jgi:uncharacterized protein
MLDLKTINNLDTKSVGYFNFKKFDQADYLLTNDVGNYIFLAEDDFKRFLTGKLTKNEKVFQRLKENLFIKDQDYQAGLIEKYREKYKFLKFGPCLHIVVVTLRCNHQCIYCHASAGGSTDKSLDMDLATAKKVVDTIFKANNRAVDIEFQGGEPLLNWPVVKFIVSYAKEKNKLEKKDLLIKLVSNFSLLDEEKMNFLLDNEVNFCTSLDGDEATHNYNRKYTGGNSYELVVKWIGKINEAYKNKYKGPKKNYYRVGAVITVSRKTLSEYKKAIDTYIDLGIKTIYLRYLNPYGFALNEREKIWYTAEEYIDFYKKALDYILAKNYNGKLFADTTAITYLVKILMQKDFNNLDMRSPCGAATGQLAYNYNGEVYTCDEGRMVARMGDQMFKLGNVNDNSLSELINNNLCKSICLASCTSGLPGYTDSVYQPYLGVCPVYNYSVYNNIFPAYMTNYKRQIDEAIIEYLFQKLKNRKNEDIFSKWVAKSRTSEVVC